MKLEDTIEFKKAWDEQVAGNSFYEDMNQPEVDTFRFTFLRGYEAASKPTVVDEKYKVIRIGLYQPRGSTTEETLKKHLNDHDKLLQFRYRLVSISSCNDSPTFITTWELKS